MSRVELVENIEGSIGLLFGRSNASELQRIQIICHQPIRGIFCPNEPIVPIV